MNSSRLEGKSELMHALHICASFLALSLQLHNSSGLLTNKIAFDVKKYRIVFFFVLQIFNGPGLALETCGREKFKINTRVGEKCLFSGALTVPLDGFCQRRAEIVLF